jgi:SAM-dependent methyltransferase
MVAWAVLPWTTAFIALAVVFRLRGPWLEGGGLLLGGALALRLLFLASHPDLSDDLYRYVWDGWIHVNGVSPYRWPPADPALAQFQSDPLFREMNSPAWISVYPPLSQVVFLLGGWLHEQGGWPLSGWGIRAGFTALEFLGVVALYGALRSRGVSRAPLILYAWNPLVLLTVAGSGHSEGGLVLGIGLLLLGLARGRAWLGWMGWMLAVLSKGIPLLLGPLLLRTLTQQVGRTAAWKGALPAATLGILFTALILTPSDLARVLSSVRLYTDLFAFNGALHPLLRTAGWSVLGVETGPILARTFALVSLGIALAVARFWPQSDGLPVSGMGTASLLILSVYLVLTPTVHPWYLLWGLPFLVVAAPTLGRPWLWMSWAALPTYLFYVGVPMLPLALVFWGGALGVLIVSVHKYREQVLAPLRVQAGRRKARWIRPWVRGTRVLDVGGGEGFVLEALGATAAPLSTVAVPTPGAGELGWVVDPEANRSGHVRALGEALPFRDQSAHTVLLSFVLHHAHDPRKVLSEALRVSEKRVIILESVPRSSLERTLLEGVDRWVNGHRGAGGMGDPAAPLNMRPAHAWVTLANELGATVIHAERPGGVHPILLLVLEPRKGRGTAVDRGRTALEDGS